MRHHVGSAPTCYAATWLSSCCHKVWPSHQVGEFFLAFPIVSRSFQMKTYENTLKLCTTKKSGSYACRCWQNVVVFFESAWRKSHVSNGIWMGFYMILWDTTHIKTTITNHDIPLVMSLSEICDCHHGAGGGSSPCHPMSSHVTAWRANSSLAACQTMRTRSVRCVNFVGPWDPKTWVQRVQWGMISHEYMSWICHVSCRLDIFLNDQCKQINLESRSMM